MHVVIDRFEEDFAVVELPDGNMLNIKKNKIPSEAKEGDVLIIKNDEILIDREETKRRKSEIEKMMDDLWE